MSYYVQLSSKLVGSSSYLFSWVCEIDGHEVSKDWWRDWGRSVDDLAFASHPAGTNTIAKRMMARLLVEALPVHVC